MKMYLFKCKGRQDLYAATRYETGSNLSSDRCSGGWEFVESVFLSGPKLPKHSDVDVTKLRRAVQQNGLYVWESKFASGRGKGRTSAPSPSPISESPAVPATLAPPELELELPTVAVAPPTPTPVAPPPPPVRPAAAPPAPVLEPPARIATPPERAPTPPSPPSLTPVAPKPEPSIAASPPPMRAPSYAPRSEPPPPMKPAPAPVYTPPPPKPVPVAASPAAPAPAATPPGRYTTVTPRPAHQVVWFDIPVLDLERAVRFYSVVLGAPLEMVQAGFGTPTIALLPHPEGAITGCLVQSTDGNPGESGPLIYLSAQGRLDEAVAAAQMNGGTIVKPKHSIGSAGSRAIVLDTEGNRIALHST